MFTVNPHRAVKFVRSSIQKALAAAGSLTAEIKYDGVRGNIVIAPIPTVSQAASSAVVLSRSNKVLPSLSQFDYLKRERWAEFQRDFLFPEGFIIDCELMIKGETFQKSQGILRRKKQVDFDRLHVVVYDLLPATIGHNNDDYEVMHCVRRIWVEQAVERLNKHFPEVTWIASESFEVYDMDELEALYAEKRAEGHEGLVVKDPFGYYKRGKKTGWWKMKPEEQADGHVIGINWGTEGLENEGRIIGFEVMSEDGHVVNANGITKAQMEEFTSRHYQGEDFTGYAVQFNFMERTDEGGFRHPSFSEWRGAEDNPTVKI